MYKLDLKALGFVKNKKVAEIVTNSVLVAKSIKDENIKLPKDDGRLWLVQSTKDATFDTRCLPLVPSIYIAIANGSFVAIFANIK